MRKTSSNRPPDYGIDAPGLVRFFFAGGAVAFLSSCLSIGFLPTHPAWQWGLGLALGAISFYLLGMGSLMVFWSKIIKIKGRETILDQVHWRGDEDVLDIRCGRGLMLVGAAKRLTTGRAVGVDIWQSADQSQNTPDAAVVNAHNEGVGERVDVQTGDMRDLPFPDRSFDVVLSHWVVHNLPSETERDRALEEMMRVLRPGGQLILADIENRHRYAAKLEALGFVGIHLMVRPLQDAVLRAVSFGSFGPATHVAIKPR